MYPEVASSAAAASLTVRLTTPSVTRPFRMSPISGPSELRPRVGLSPTSPQQAAGMRMEPPPSLAWATGTTPEATAAAEPPEEPPGVRFTSQGFLAGPYNRDSVTGGKPNSGTFVLAKGMKPARLNLATTCASAVAGVSGRKEEPARVGMPAQNPVMSLSSSGTPAKGWPSGLKDLAAARACS